MNDFEERLKALKLVEPSERYTSYARSLFRASEPKKPMGLAWALAACLALSLSANLYLISVDHDQPSGSEVVNRGGATKQIHGVYVPGNANQPHLRIKENS
ncbi:MAG: hypothetical protein U5L08_01440 [Xanthomonadales bacterium]|nr:hypothetical protein [Xanthomonadales bacterium]